MNDQDLRAITDYEDSRSIAKEIFWNHSFPDHRLRRRAISIISTLLRHPGKPYQQSFGSWGQTKGFYRFIENERITPMTLNSAIFESGANNCKGHKKIYAVNDTTAVELSHETLGKELGSIDQFPKHRGLFLHTTLAVSSKGVPLGVLDQQIWTRSKDNVQNKKNRKKLPIEEKESNKWLKAVSNTIANMEQTLGDNTIPKVIFVGDQESDIYEYFVKVKESGVGTITRVYHNRNVDEPASRLRDRVGSQEVEKQIIVEVPKKRNQKARKAVVSIRYVREVTLKAPQHLESRMGEIRLGAIWAKEDNPPAGLKKREIIDWFLLTTEKLDTVDDAIEIIQKYKHRWRIEDIHFILKSGLGIEKNQFETFDRHQKTIILLTEVAFELLRLTYLSRVSPKLAATEILTELQIQVLLTKTLIRAGPLKTLTIGAAVKLIGRMGGHLGRKSDGSPGVKTLWRGWRDLQLLVEYTIALRNAEMQM